MQDRNSTKRSINETLSPNNHSPNNHKQTKTAAKREDDDQDEMAGTGTSTSTAGKEDRGKLDSPPPGESASKSAFDKCPPNDINLSETLPEHINCRICKQNVSSNILQHFCKQSLQSYYLQMRIL